MYGAVLAPSESPLTFVACISDDQVLESNLLASPCLGHGSPHEVILIRNCTSAADGLNLGLSRAANEWIILVHQDVTLPRGWDRSLRRQLRTAHERFGPIGVAGVYGVGPAIRQNSTLGAERFGWVIVPGAILHEEPQLPARVSVLDELLMVIRKDTPLRFDPELGFHLYGADLCLQAAKQDLAVVAIEAPCEHNTRHFVLPPDFYRSAAVFARKWRHRLPVATPCVVIDEATLLPAL